MTRWLKLLPLVLAALIGACSTVPETGRPQLVMTNTSSDAEEGALVFRELKSKSAISRNPSANAQVNRVGNRIIAVIPPQKVKWEFVVFQNSEPNAFALPGGKVGVNTGILPITQNDTGMATVLAHEIGHVVARHGSESKSQNILASVGATAVDVGLAVGTGISSAARGAIISGVGAGASVGIFLPFSRTHEYEADRLGLIYMARAGYNPRESVAFWKRMKAYSDKHSENNSPSFLRTHPLDDARIRSLEKYLPEAVTIYEQVKAGR